MFLAIAVDNLADAQSLTEIEEEKAEEKERTKSVRRSKSKSPEKDEKVGNCISSCLTRNKNEKNCKIAMHVYGFMNYKSETHWTKPILKTSQF